MKQKFLQSIISRVLVSILMASLVFMGCLSSAGLSYEPGIYEGSGMGYRGLIWVRVFLSEGGIEDIEILEHQEDAFAVEALEELRELALEMNSADLDAVSGATASSIGFLTALETALSMSR